jgi:hypothetical protein
MQRIFNPESSSGLKNILNAKSFSLCNRKNALREHMPLHFRKVKIKVWRILR